MKCFITVTFDTLNLWICTFWIFTWRGQYLAVITLITQSSWKPHSPARWAFFKKNLSLTQKTQNSKSRRVWAFKNCLCHITIAIVSCVCEHLCSRTRCSFCSTSRTCRVERSGRPRWSCSRDSSRMQRVSSCSRDSYSVPSCSTSTSSTGTGITGSGVNVRILYTSNPN